MEKQKNYELEARIAESLFYRHNCNGSRTILARENCGACMLNGFHDTENGKPYAPKYSGWARIYVQAGCPIPQRYHEAFEAEKNSDNELYRNQLLDDIAHYGVKEL